jgi:hypothetical protein
MQSVNFIPARRITAKQRRRQINRWAVTVSVYAMLLIGVYACSYALWGGGHAAIADEERKTSLRVEQAKRAISTLQGELTAEEATLKANQALADQPDWSVLLVLVAGSLSDEVVLNRCDLRPGQVLETAAAGSPAPGPPPSGPPSPAPGAAATPGPFVLTVAGYGKTMTAVSQFVLALERLALFDQVRLIKTNREPFQSTQAVAFQIECSLGNNGGGPK